MSARLPLTAVLIALVSFALVACPDDSEGPTGATSVPASQTDSAKKQAVVDAVPADTAPKPAPAAGSAVEEGEALYVRYCKLCHGEGARGYAADNAPSLVSRSFLESATNGFIASGIRMGRPNTAMAAYGKSRGGPLGETEIRKLVAYLRSLGPQARTLPVKKDKGDAKAGATLFQTHCHKCHGDSEQRGTAVSLHNPELLASASAAFLRYAIVQGRQGTPMQSFAGQLSGQQIEDVVAFIRSNAPSAPTAPVRSTEVPKDLPVVVNPKGKAPSFKLRDERFVSAAQVKQALSQKRRMVVVDARSPADWIQFRIPGAIPVAYYDTDQLDKIPNDGTWVVAYCACPHHASGRVVDALRKRGFKHTAILDEGILHWKKEGYPLEGEAVTSAK